MGPRGERGVAQAGAPAARPAWMDRAERGGLGLTRLYAALARKLGRPPARVLLYPICLYFVAFAPAARRASRQYLRYALGREPRLNEVFRHFHTFASTLLDRVFLLGGAYSQFEVRTFNEEIVRDRQARGEGCFLLGAHLGSFEVVRAMGRNTGAIDVSMVMYEDNARKVNAVLNAIDPAADLDVIALGRVDSMLEVERALAAGRFVGLLGDRTISGEGTVACPFLGRAARFPVAPLRLAAMLGQRVVLMFGLYCGGNRYDIHWEALADFRDVARAERGAAVDAALRRYVERLEHYCRLAPYNWFNFYDFWA